MYRKFHFWGQKLNISGLKSAMQLIRHVCPYSRNKHRWSILSCWGDLVTCSARFNIQGEWSIPQLWNTVERENFSFKFTGHSYTQIFKRLSDFVTCRKRFYNQSGGGLYLSFGILW